MVKPLQVKCLDYTAAAREVRFIERATSRELGYVIQYIGMIFDYSEIAAE